MTSQPVSSSISPEILEAMAGMMSFLWFTFSATLEWIPKPYKDAGALRRAIGRNEFKRATNLIFHDAVMEVARVWYKAWSVFVK